MPARTTRKEARERLLKTMLDALDRIIPEDESKPLKGTTFGSWEDQTDQFKPAMVPTILEERAALQDNARVQEPGCCPFCGSDWVYLEKQTTQPEVLCPHGQKGSSRSWSCVGPGSAQTNAGIGTGKADPLRQLTAA